MKRMLIAVSLVAVVSGCSRHTTSDEPRPQTNLITREEIAAAPVTTAYDATDRWRRRP
jgi:hypothetical protein